MLKMMTNIQARLNSEKGATAVEYALIVGGIAVAVLGAIQLFGGGLSAFFSGLVTKLGLN